jgi:hypothetical protein
MIVALIMCLLLLAMGLSSLSLGNTSGLLDSALDFLSLLSAGLTLDDIAVLYNTTRTAAPFYIKKYLIDGCWLPKSLLIKSSQYLLEPQPHLFASKLNYPPQFEASKLSHTS